MILILLSTDDRSIAPQAKFVDLVVMMAGSGLRHLHKREGYIVQHIAMHRQGAYTYQILQSRTNISLGKSYTLLFELPKSNILKQFYLPEKQHMEQRAWRAMTPELTRRPHFYNFICFVAFRAARRGYRCVVHFQKSNLFVILNFFRNFLTKQSRRHNFLISNLRYRQKLLKIDPHPPNPNRQSNLVFI